MQWIISIFELVRSIPEPTDALTQFMQFILKSKRVIAFLESKREAIKAEKVSLAFHLLLLPSSN
jgi:hypothetical protein